MSFINDALKQSQRDRDKLLAQRSAVPFAESVIPYPEDNQKGRKALIFVGGIAAAVVLAVATGLFFRDRSIGSRKPPASPSPTTATAPVAPGPMARAPNGTPIANLARGVPAVSTPPSSAQLLSPYRPAPRVAASDARTRRISRAVDDEPAPITRSEQPLRAAGPRTVASAPPIVEPTSGSMATEPGAPPASAPLTIRSQSATPAPVSISSSVRLVMAPAGSGPADSLFKLAYMEHIKGNLAGAQSLYEKSIRTGQAPAEAFNNYGALLVQRGDQAAAAEMFTQAVKRDDKNVEAWINLGDSHLAAGHHAEALSDYARAGQLDPYRIAVKTRLANEYAAIGDTATARRLFEDAVRAAPNDASAHYSYGGFLQARADYRGAIREFDRFIELAPSNYSADFIGEVRGHVASLRRLVP